MKKKKNKYNHRNQVKNKLKFKVIRPLKNKLNRQSMIHH